MRHFAAIGTQPYKEHLMIVKIMPKDAESGTILENRAD
jgi:hypothetical protein